MQELETNKGPSPLEEVKTLAKAISPRKNLAVSVVDKASIVPSKTSFS
jgi:hypothetical protein